MRTSLQNVRCNSTSPANRPNRYSTFACFRFITQPHSSLLTLSPSTVVCKHTAEQRNSTEQHCGKYSTAGLNIRHHKLEKAFYTEGTYMRSALSCAVVIWSILTSISMLLSISNTAPFPIFFFLINSSVGRSHQGFFDQWQLHHILIYYNHSKGIATFYSSGPTSSNNSSQERKVRTKILLKFLGKHVRPLKK